ncbi:InlB B-repeat-containing protein [Treponema primitia]|uniref:InlB B-repeat-containing protein n=1 Tax=Treponema primitia TaxID=88058 RepID=UPI0018E1BAA3|nr:InlB B-repeat-containing protein [Treponema primitia]
MKKNIFLIAILGMAMVFGMVLTGCPGPEDPKTEYTVIFNANGGTVTPGSEIVKEGSAIGNLPTPTKTTGDTVFWGWFTSDGTNDVWGGEFTSSTKVIADITIYARWGNTDKPATYTITFNPDGGTVSPTTIQVVTGDKVGPLPTPTKSGSNFEGWYINPTDSGTKFTETSSVTGGITVYAKWAAAGGGGGITKEGTLEVTNIPSDYIDKSYYITVQGNNVNGGNGSGRVYGGNSLTDSTITTVPIKAATTSIPLFWRNGFTDTTLNIRIYITPDNSYSLSGPAQPENITVSKQYSSKTFSNKSLSVAWTGDGDGDGDGGDGDGDGGDGGQSGQGITFSDGLPSGEFKIKIFSSTLNDDDIGDGLDHGTYVTLGLSSVVSDNTVTLLLESGNTWNASGSFIVLLETGPSGSHTYKRATVTFTNGSGTVAKASMVDWSRNVENTKFEGTWFWAESDRGLVFSGNNFLNKRNGEDDMKGTFTFTDTQITFNVSNVWEDGQWKLPGSTEQQDIKNYTLVGDILTIIGEHNAEYVKQDSTGTMIIDNGTTVNGCAYSQKTDTITDSNDNKSTQYLLSISYDAALALNTNKLGSPDGDQNSLYANTNLSSGTDWVILEYNEYRYSEGSISYTNQVRLVQNSSTSSGKRWNTQRSE